MVLTCASSVVFSQTRFEIMGGGARSDVRKSGPGSHVSTQPFYGWFAGVRLQHNFTDHFYSIFSASESVRGYGQKAFQIKNRLIYSDLHAMAGYDFDHHFGVCFGGFMSVLSKSSIKTSGSNWEDPAVEMFNNLDGGVCAEANYVKGKVSFFARYNYGLGNLDKYKVTDENGNTLGTAKLRDQFLEIGSGICLLKK